MGPDAPPDPPPWVPAVVRACPSLSALPLLVWTLQQSTGWRVGVAEGGGRTLEWAWLANPAWRSKTAFRGPVFQASL